MSKSNKKIAPVAPVAEVVAPEVEVVALRAEVARLREQVARQEAAATADKQRVYDLLAARRREQAERAERLGINEPPSDAAVAERIWAEVARQAAVLAAVAADPTREGLNALREGRYAITDLQRQLHVLRWGYLYTAI